MKKQIITALFCGSLLAGGIPATAADLSQKFAAQEEPIMVEVVNVDPRDTVVESTPVMNKEPVFGTVEQSAKFPGGMQALMKFLAENLKYPESARENNIQGRVIVKFIVEKDGSITNAKIAKGVDQNLDNEAIRIVKMMPKWRPGINNGVAVRSFYILPVRFSLAQ